MVNDNAAFDDYRCMTPKGKDHSHRDFDYHNEHKYRSVEQKMVSSQVMSTRSQS